MLPDENFIRLPRPKKGGKATKREQAEIDVINTLAKTFGVDVYLYFSINQYHERPSKPFFLSWKKSREGKVHRRFYQRVEDAAKNAHRLISTLPPIID